MKSIIIMVDAVLTRVSISRNAIAMTINSPVINMLIWGVSNRLFTRASIGGSNRSLLIAIGDLDAVNIPPLAVVKNAVIAAKLNTANPHLPINLLAAVEIGIELADSSSPLNTPTVTVTTLT